MNHKLKVIGAVSGLACVISSIGLAAGVIENPTFEEQALILPEFDRLHVEAPVAVDFAVMNVRVFNSNNELVMNSRSFGEPVEFMVNSGLPDGVYRFEAVSIFTTDDLSKISEIESPAEESMLRNFGSFEVSGGEIIQQVEALDSGDADEASIMDKVIKHSMSLAGFVLDTLVPSAHAADISTTPNGDLYVEDTSPAFLMQYGASSGVDDGVNIWVLQAFEGGGATADFDILSAGVGSSGDVLTFKHGSGNADSIFVDANGDMHWAGGGLNFDRSASQLSIGTLLSPGDLTISSFDPDIDLYDESTSNSMGINYNGTDFSIFNTGGSDVVGINAAAPFASLHMQSNGDIGFGTAAPAAKLHAVAGNTSRVLVENTTALPAAGDQIMFQLQSAASNKVRFIIGNAGGTWTFDNAGNGSFQINRAGTGVNEFRVEPNGDAYILRNSYATNHINTSSRASKTDFAEVDEVAILEKLTALPMSTWRYKIEKGDERHLGPIAEDFQQAFGLSDGKHISTIDASGVALSAIKGLNTVLKERTEQIAELTQANQALEERLTHLENVLLHLNEVAVR